MATNVKLWLCWLGIAAVPLAAQAPDLSGTWHSDSNASLKWILSQKGDQLHVQEFTGNRVETDFTCSLLGTECVAKKGGRSEKISMYFNGAKLVEIRERGESAIKQWLTVSADGKTLTVETVPLVSGEKPETVSFHRQDTQTN
jgi:hypothetical protein